VRTRTASSSITSTAIIMPPASPYGKSPRRLKPAQKLAERPILLLQSADPQTVEAFTAEHRYLRWIGTREQQLREIETSAQSSIHADPGTVRAVFACADGYVYLEAETTFCGIVLHWWLKVGEGEALLPPELLRFQGTYRQLVEYCKEWVICPSQIAGDYYVFSELCPKKGTTAARNVRERAPCGTFQLLKLPRELRDQIYAYTHPHVDWCSSTVVATPEQRPTTVVRNLGVVSSLSVANRQVAQEYKESLQRNTQSQNTQSRNHLVVAWPFDNEVPGVLNRVNELPNELLLTIYFAFVPDQYHLDKVYDVADTSLRTHIRRFLLIVIPSFPPTLSACQTISDFAYRHRQEVTVVVCVRGQRELFDHQSALLVGLGLVKRACCLLSTTQLASDASRLRAAVCFSLMVAAKYPNFELQARGPSTPSSPTAAKCPRRAIEIGRALAREAMWPWLEDEPLSPPLLLLLDKVLLH